jgi:hypothetical protein
MFKREPNQAPPPAAIPLPTMPDASCMRRAWVILADGRVGYIDHYKNDGKFGVRPVEFETGMHYPSTSAHWTDAQRNAVPEEFALSINQFRGAHLSEIPTRWRLGVSQ